MKILVATDGSPCSQAAVREVSTRPWPAGSDVEVLHVVSSGIPPIPEPTFTLAAAHEAVLTEARAHAPQIVDDAATDIRAAQPGLHVSTKIVEGPPKSAIVDEAAEWAADLIVLGAHGFGAVKRLLLGSVSQAVALHAPCSVEIVRSEPCLDEAPTG